MKFRDMRSRWQRLSLINSESNQKLSFMAKQTAMAIHSGDFSFVKIMNVNRCSDLRLAVNWLFEIIYLEEKICAES